MAGFVRQQLKNPCGHHETHFFLCTILALRVTELCIQITVVTVFTTYFNN
jgi:hypothetical protein